MITDSRNKVTFMVIDMLFPEHMMLFLFWNQVIEVAVKIKSELL